MNYVLDTHTHTLASGHAYSTIREMAAAAAEKGLKILGITEHAPKMPGSCREIYFRNLAVVDREYYGVRLLLGCELNILDFEGNVDLPEAVLKKMDLVIASMHTPCMEKGSSRDYTRAYLRVMENPYVHIIGHPDDSRFPVDFPALVKAAKETGKVLELNNHSLDPRGTRVGAEVNDLEMLRLCRKYQVPVTVGSDAHVDTMVGNHGHAYRLLNQVDFPAELVLNHSVEIFERYVHTVSGNGKGNTEA